MTEKPDKRPLSQVIYDVFGYSPGGTITPDGTVIVYTQSNYDPKFAIACQELHRLIESGTMACKLAKRLLVMNKPR